jgi:hypothetical protein
MFSCCIGCMRVLTSRRTMKVVALSDVLLATSMTARAHGEHHGSQSNLVTATIKLSLAP